MKLKRLYTFINSDLDIIEKALEETIQAEHPVLKEASMHLLQAGGKRIRPVFVLLSGKFGNYNIDEIKNVAVALELIHTASLVHDDVIDNAELRRGGLTVKAKWDNRIAMYTGDYIFARAVELMTNINKIEAHQVLSKTMVELVIGEIEQIKDKYDWDQNLRTYFRRIKRKTAILIAVSCGLGAIVSEAPIQVQRQLYRFGYNVGMAFQITDDILDFTGTEKELGKPAGSDLQQGNITLPALYALRNENLRKEIVTTFDPNNEEKMRYIISLVKTSGGIEYSKEISERYLKKAHGIIKELPNCKEKTALLNIAKYIGKRKF
ncbi:heptaprenyl diphosphate synthase component II [Schinkia azotoformans MEV2011]|uniref:Heptaprenyl diphosphate synthase component 2 n=2 Tax=Schinkia azotoformans TaxID=1454 RepID=K6DGA5_SCHAZ|nr:heptaprenyl diphosphate synthase component II [Schinkia azotoformans]EKN67354.1 heptaprenyl diphosphate synthase component II [Schinkia azotoformans LMG 9581]KEF40545.1 heptaprenyl diphosphate synthase component II [Schinkia azotoformans MEV2011]MEC1639393.1 heptaprenyl diphosphate synthase component II [Schinkia azotoformans]MEC1696049.1 heptaprenyl diphosphate synthase component II [Schinkia azotoformans]MEC1716737.1 heptaprenyl diphosphate synthase component II [Schinkia azotoformans]